MSEQRPHFLIVCNHGIDGGPLDPVARFEWGEHGWYLPLQFTAAALRPLTGDQITQPHLGDEATRLHYEIPCQETRCSTWAYRSDDEKLQTLLTKIATDETFRDAVTVSADEKLIVMRLYALHLARRYAKKDGLHV